MAELSAKQQKIFEMSEQDLTPATIAEKLGIPERVVKAQLTRIQEKLRKSAVSEKRREARSHVRKPAAEPAEVVQAAAEAGAASYEIPDVVQTAGEKAAEGTDIHPMVLLGVTIQFVKLVGGRLRAHQVIEDVYDALRAMVQDGNPASSSLTPPEFEKAQALNGGLEQLQQAISGLRESLQSFTT